MAKRGKVGAPPTASETLNNLEDTGKRDGRSNRATGRTELWGVRVSPGFKEDQIERAKKVGVTAGRLLELQAAAYERSPAKDAPAKTPKRKNNSALSPAVVHALETLAVALTKDADRKGMSPADALEDFLVEQLEQRKLV